MSMSINHLQIGNGDKTNGPITSSAANGVVMNSNTLTPAVNGNGQLGATAMFNLAKIASSDKKQTTSSANNSVVTSGVTSVRSVPAPTPPTQIIMTPPSSQPRATFTHTNPVPRAPILIPRGANTISLPAGVSLPPGTILMQNEKGQIVFMSRAPVPPNLEVPPPPAGMVRYNAAAHFNHNHRAPPIVRQLTPQLSQPPALQSHHRLHTPSYTISQQSQAAGGAIPIQPNPGQMIMRPAMGGNMPIRPQAPPTNIASRPPIMPAGQNIDRSKDEITKCKNFLDTLIRLSSQQPQQTLDNVKKLIQGLLEGTVKPDVFTDKLQIELNSQKQPGLSSFLKKSLPELRQAIGRNELTIEGLNRTLTIPIQQMPSIATPTMHNNIIPKQTSIRPSSKMSRNQINMIQRGQNVHPAGSTLRAVGASSIRPTAVTPSPMRQTITRSPASSLASSHKGKQRLDLKDDDDINDVATMGGVNLSEETKNILAAVPESSGQLRSCRDDLFLTHTPLAQKIRQLALQRGVRDVNNDVISLVSHACEERLRHLTEKVSLLSEHRLDINKLDKRYDTSHDVRSQLKFIEELDKLERKKHDDSEREVLLKAAKSRSKTEDPEQAKLKMKAREMKEQELEELRQQEANKTALAAIGPRKKRKFDDLIANAAAGSSTSSNNFISSNSSSNNQGYNRPRLKRVNLRDLTFVLEEDKESYKSDTIFKAFLR